MDNIRIIIRHVISSQTFAAVIAVSTIVFAIATLAYIEKLQKGEDDE